MVLILILLGLCYFLEKGRRRWVMKIIKMDKKIEKEQNRELEQYSSFARKCTIRPAYGWEDCGRKGTHHGINTSGRRSEYSDKKGMFINETGKADHWILV